MKKLICLFWILPYISFSQDAGENKEIPVLVNSGSITFTRSAQTLGDGRTFAVAIEDFDNDNDNDVFLTDYLGLSKLWLNDGNGSFTQSDQVFNTQEIHDVQVADLNGDGYPDLFLLSHADPSKVYFNNGSGIFTASQQDIGLPEEAPGSLVLTDVDLDGDMDAFIQYYRLPNRLWLNNGSGIFTITGTMYGAAINSGRWILGDFNDDPYPDLFLCQVDESDEVWLNDGNGHYSNTDQTLGSNLEGHEHIDSGDVDGDGDTDVVVIHSSLGVKIWLNQDNTGIFNESGEYFGGGGIRCKLFDAELDGDLDLISVPNEAGNLLWLNDGQGNYTSIGVVFGSPRALGIQCGDIDSDNDLDVILGMGEGSGGNPIYYNESIITGINDQSKSVDMDFKLKNFPNPFKKSTTITYQLPFQTNISLKVFDTSGQLVTTIIDKKQMAGKQGFEFYSNNLSNGVYYFQITSPEFSATSTMIINN